jgi:hypothetical protein
MKNSLRLLAALVALSFAGLLHADHHGAKKEKADKPCCGCVDCKECKAGNCCCAAGDKADTKADMKAEKEEKKAKKKADKEEKPAGT